MKVATAQLESISPYSQSRYHDMPHREKEMADAYEQRTWREHCHCDENGKLFIPPMAFKNCIAEAAKFLSIKTKGQATWTKHFEAGILVLEGIKLPISKDEVEGETLFLNSDGVRGSGSRVKRTYPLIRKWSGSVVFHIVDDTITQDAFLKHLQEAGNLIGIGRFRPRNRGFYGRFRVVKVDWQDMTQEAEAA